MATPVHLGRPEGLRGERRGDRRVDAAREAEHDLREAALADVIAEPQREGLERLRLGRRADLGERCAGRDASSGGVHVADEKVLLEVAPAHHQVALAVEPERVPVEHQLVVAPDLVHVEQGSPVLRRFLSNHVAADRGLADREGTRRDIEQDRGAAVGELAHRVAGIEALRPEVAIVPDLLAHGQPEAHAFEVEWLDAAAGLEVAVLVEDVVGRQQRLVVTPGDAAPVTERRGVEERVAVAGGVRGHAADHEPEPVVGQRRDAREQVEIRADEALVVEQVARRVAGGRELGEHDEVRTGATGAVHGLAHLVVGLLEGSDREVQLRQRESHVAIVPNDGSSTLTGDQRPLI